MPIQRYVQEQAVWATMDPTGSDTSWLQNRSDLVAFHCAILKLLLACLRSWDPRTAGPDWVLRMPAAQCCSRLSAEARPGCSWLSMAEAGNPKDAARTASSGSLYHRGEISPCILAEPLILTYAHGL